MLGKPKFQTFLPIENEIVNIFSIFRLLWCNSFYMLVQALINYEEIKVLV